MMSARSSRNGLAWAIVGGVVLLAAVIAIIVSAVLAQQGAGPSASPSSNTSPTSEPEGPVEDFVDASVVDRGWVAEPITADRDRYITAALEAASTFDTTRGTREEWLDYLDTWFTPDTRYAESDRGARMKAAQVELRQGVVLPSEQWNALLAESGRVRAIATGDIAFVPVDEDASGDMSIGTSDVTLTFTRSDGGDGETSYEETVRVSVQVLCGAGSVPTPDSTQSPGDCKVVRYFTEPLEP